jgi:glycosyltransferase involved in cell wall biosynthesis
MARGDPRTITLVFRRHAPTVFSIENLFKRFQAQLETSGVAVKRLELPYISTGITSVLRNIWFIARQRDLGVVHITGDVHYAAILRPFVKTVVTVHDCVVMQRGVGFKRLALKMLWFGIPLRLASAVVVISEQTRREVLALVPIPEHKLSVIPNFVDPAFTFSKRAFAAIPRILHIGTTANKNLPAVIAALTMIRCVLVIVGEIPPTTQQLLRASGIDYENVIAVDQAKMLDLYRGADLISFPSTYEGFGMPVLEGQAMGRPILTSDLEPLRTVAGVGGAFLVNPHSVDSIRDGFRRLLEDAELRSQLVAAGSKNCARFTLTAAITDYRAIYGRI